MSNLEIIMYRPYDEWLFANNIKSINFLSSVEYLGYTDIQDIQNINSANQYLSTLIDINYLQLDNNYLGTYDYNIENISQDVKKILGILVDLANNLKMLYLAGTKAIVSVYPYINRCIVMDIINCLQRANNIASLGLEKVVAHLMASLHTLVVNLDISKIDKIIYDFMF